MIDVFLGAVSFVFVMLGLRIGQEPIIKIIRVLRGDDECD
jgi:hypothetical protein